MTNMLLDLLFPKFCLNCKKYGSYFCDQCASLIKRHKQICVVCQQIAPLGKTHPKCLSHTPLDGIIIATEYKAVIKTALHSIKYKLSYDILSELAAKTLISEKIKQCLIEENITCVTEVPMHEAKEKKRGFNQAKLICNWVQKNYQISYLPTLRKTKQTTSQMQLKRQDRIFNLIDAFQIIPNTNLEDKNILLCDDVTTTATTLEECAKILKSNGAAKVYGLVIASGR